MTFGRVAEALPRAIRLVGWPKLVIFFFFFFFYVKRFSLSLSIRLVGWAKDVKRFSLSLSRGLP